ncbi:MAG: glycosyltransferase, partial [Elusimicrobiota bacterium]
MTKSKILLVSKLYHPWIGGVEQHVQLLAEEMAKEFDIRALCCQENAPTAPPHSSLLTPYHQIINGIPVFKAPSLGIYWSMPVSPAFPFWFKRLAREADLIHLHLPFPLAEFSQWILRPGAKLVITWHSDIVRQKFFARALSPLSRWILERAQIIITTSEQLAQNSRALQCFRAKTQIIPLAIKTERFVLTPAIQKEAQAIRRRYGTPLILFVGRLVPYKGLAYLLDALPGVTRQAKLLLIGDGPLSGALRDMAKRLGLDERAIFLGAKTDENLAAYYHACDLFILPSVSPNEAFGVVQMEAMAAGKPVINTALATGVPGVSLDQQTGLTVPPCDSEALVQAINKILQNEPWRQQLGQNALERVRTLFSAEALAG